MKGQCRQTSLVVGLLEYQVKPSSKFTRNYKILSKAFKSSRQKDDFETQIREIVKSIQKDPKLQGSFNEPLPSNLSLPADYELRKYTFQIPNRKGAAGEGRLIYLVDNSTKLIILIWLYSHEDFKKRPPDQDLASVIKDNSNGD